MALSYVDTETVFSGITGPPALYMKTLSAIGFYCYNALTEATSTTNHGQRIAFVNSQFGGYRQNLLTSPTPLSFTTVYQVLQAMGDTNSTSDSTVQAHVNAIMENLLVAL